MIHSKKIEACCRICSHEPYLIIRVKRWRVNFRLDLSLSFTLSLGGRLTLGLGGRVFAWRDRERVCCCFFHPKGWKGLYDGELEVDIFGRSTRKRRCSPFYRHWQFLVGILVWNGKTLSTIASAAHRFYGLARKYRLCLLCCRRFKCSKKLQKVAFFYSSNSSVFKVNKPNLLIRIDDKTANGCFSPALEGSDHEALEFFRVLAC